MKTLLIVRHAKTKQAGLGEADYDRELNTRGENDAPAMAKRMQERNIKPNLFISSPAKRAKQTCKAFAKVFKTGKDKIDYKEELYNASQQAYNNVLKNVKDKVKCVAIFGHNPGITEFADSLCEEVHIDNMQTCSVFAVEVKINSWADFAEAKKKFLFYDYPAAKV